MKQRDYIIIVLLSVLFLLLSTYIPAYGFEQGRDWDVMCSITNKEPFYDCNEKWILVWKNSYTIKTPSGDWVLGFAVHGNLATMSVSLRHEYNVCNTHPQINQTNAEYCGYQWMGISNKVKSDNCYGGPTFCISILAHEIKHLKCNCDWHKQLKPTLKNRVIQLRVL